MDERYIAQYRDLYERHWWWRARERYILDALQRAAPPGGWRRILDIGCGDGLFFNRLTELGEVEGVDPAAHAGSRWADRIHTAPFDASFDPGRRYSLILFLDVLEHLDRPEEAVRAATRLLDEGGAILITVPAFPQLWTRHDDLNRHRIRYTTRTLTALVNSAGLEALDARYLFQSLAAAKLIIRARERIISGEPRAPRVPGSLLNRGLELACAWEARILGPIRPPFGSSLMMLARRAQ